jgi:RNA polymerase sigma-70 factor, ECF subfamily
MSEHQTAGITSLLHAWRDGDDEALNRLTPLVYDHLDRLAHFYMVREQTGHILQDTALISETYLRLAKLREIEWKSTTHFYVVCAQLMQRILTDYARSELYQKRRGREGMVPFDEQEFLAEQLGADLVALEDALKDLRAVDGRKAQVVQLRFFVGLSTKEIAEVLAISERTVDNDWKFAKLWLFHQLSRRQNHAT